MGRAIGLFLTGAVFLSVPITNALFHGSCPLRGVILALSLHMGGACGRESRAADQHRAGNPHIDGLEGVFPEGV